MATQDVVMRCEDCPDREFDNPGSARGHANRLGHKLIGVSLALVAPKDQNVLPALTGEVRAQLESLSDVIRANMDKGKKGLAAAWEARFEIATALTEARNLMRGDLEFGRWVKEQNFGFAATTRKQYLRLGTHLEEAKDKVIESGGDIGFRKLVTTIDPPAAKPVVVSEPAQVSPQKVMDDFVMAKATESLLALDIESVGLVPTEERNWLSHEFRKVIEKMVRINEAWRDAEEG